MGVLCDHRMRLSRLGAAVLTFVVLELALGDVRFPSLHSGRGHFERPGIRGFLKRRKGM